MLERTNTPSVGVGGVAISIRQPWAWLIMHGGKDVENRTWNYVPKRRGRIWIHAAKGMTQDEYEEARFCAENIWEQAGEKHRFPKFGELERGGIIGSAEIIGYLDNDTSKEALYPWYFGNLGIVLHDPQPCEFVPLKGALGFFSVGGGGAEPRRNDCNEAAGGGVSFLEREARRNRVINEPKSGNE